MRKITVLLLSILSLNLFGQLNLIEYQLDNGFTVILNPDPTATEVAGMVAVATGSKNDPINATGVSHYLEHLLFKGTSTLGTANYEKEKPHLDSILTLYEKLGQTEIEESRTKIQSLINEQAVAAAEYGMPNEFDKLIKSIGSTKVNASTNQDMTSYYNNFPPHQLEKWLDIYAHRFQNPVFRSFQSELEVVYEEKNRAMDNMERNVQEAFAKQFYSGHPYGERNTLGEIEHLKNPPLKLMYDYFNRYYVPSNMALVLCGNFDVEKAKPLIEEKFGVFKKSNFESPSYPELKAFEERAVYKVRMTPIKAGILSYRTVPVFHEDYTALRVISRMLSNEAGVGLINELSNENKLMQAFTYTDFLDEAGDQTVVFLPKVIGQSFKKAESLIIDQFQKIRKGEFTDDLLAVATSEVYRDDVKWQENINNRGYRMATYFRNNRSVSQMQTDIETVKNISREEIIATAEKYFSKGYFVMQSRTGFPKKQKLSKPPYQAVKANQDRESEYAKKFNSIPSSPPKPKVIDLQKDVIQTSFGQAGKLFKVKNPLNEMYELKIRFHGGLKENPVYEVLAEALDYAHPANQSFKDFRASLSKRGTSLYFEATNSFFDINIDGLESNLTQDLNDIQNLMKELSFTEKSMKSVYNMYKTDRKAEKEEAVLFARALATYGIYGENSPFLRRPKLSDIKKITVKDLQELWTKIKASAVNIHFSGKDLERIETNLKSLPFNLNANSPLPYPVKVREQKENEVFILDNKKLVQSHLFFVRKGNTFSEENLALMDLFNLYYDDGFSGILTQEVREYRSLAYTSSANFRYINQDGTPTYFYTYVGCQGDKTNEAVSLVQNLISELPKKEERFEGVLNKSKLKASTSYPNFRGLSSRIESIEFAGFKQDPNQLILDQNESETSFEAMYKFYQSEIANQNGFLGIYGDTKRFDQEKLKVIGTVKFIQQEDIINF